MVCTQKTHPCENNDCQICFNKSFASHEKAKYWSNKNISNPRKEFKRTTKVFWFDCDCCTHDFSKSLDAISNKKWCPYCAHRKLCEDETCVECFNNSFASHRKSKYWSKKNKLHPRQIFTGTQTKFWFDCKCGHDFKICLNMVGKNWCPYCCRTPKLLCEDKTCQQCFDKSFASHRKAKYWSDKNKLSPRQVFLNQNSPKFWFNCKCGHEIQKVLNSISNDAWCPYCSSPPKLLCEDETCQQCWANSFASHKKSKYWAIKNKKNPRQVFKNSSIKFWFDCKCGHEFNTTLSHVNKGWCSYCCNPPQKLCDANETCQQCWTNSFASHKKSKYWSTKNKLVPRQVFRSSGKKAWFDCKVCNEDFYSAISSINNGTWCPYCKHKTEKKIFKWLNNYYEEIVSKQAKFDWCKNKRQLPFDICIEILKIIIEIDGDQHFRQVRNYKSPDEATTNDIYKMKCALENGYSIIRICQDDVWNNKIDWKAELTIAIRKYDTPRIIYISKDYELYDYHKF